MEIPLGAAVSIPSVKGTDSIGLDVDRRRCPRVSLIPLGSATLDQGERLVRVDRGLSRGSLTRFLLHSGNARQDLLDDCRIVGYRGVSHEWQGCAAIRGVAP